MSDNQKKPDNKKTIIALIIVIGVVLVSGFVAILAFGNPKSSSQPSGQAYPTGGQASPDCSSGGPCTGLSNGTPSGCTSDGPCTQNSSGQRIIPGKVVSVSTTSITIKLTTGGSDQTFDVTAATRMNKGGNSADTAFNASDIALGDQVAIVQSGSQTDLVMLNFQSQMEKAH